MPDMYEVMGQIREQYHALQDALSREIYEKRLLRDIAPTPENMRALTALVTAPPPERFSVERERQRRYTQALDAIAKLDGDLILYGCASTGLSLHDRLARRGRRIAGFCSGHARKHPDGILGKPVYPPEWLPEHADEIRVIIAATDTYGSFSKINRRLRELDFPEERIVRDLDEWMTGAEGLSDEAQFDYGAAAQYFEFPAYYPRGTAFLDCGCFDGGTSIRFAKWCGGDYSKILAFEPDPLSLDRSVSHMNAAGLHDFEVLPYGAWDRPGTVRFEAAHSGSSRIVRDAAAGAARYDEIRVMPIDEVVGSERVGFIKMDIEGAEWQALHGAERTIVRDRPLLAICVYHRPGDTQAIMGYCQSIVPAYRFWLRHYDDASAAETVLYAAVENT